MNNIYVECDDGGLAALEDKQASTPRCAAAVVLKGQRSGHSAATVLKGQLHSMYRCLQTSAITWQGVRRINSAQLELTNKCSHSPSTRHHFAGQVDTIVKSTADSALLCACASRFQHRRCSTPHHQKWLPSLMPLVSSSHPVTSTIRPFTMVQRSSTQPCTHSLNPAP